MGGRTARLALLTVLLSGCSISIGEEDSRPPGCETFDRIAVRIESQGPRADVGDELRQIEREAQAGGDDAVAAAAAELLSAQGGPNADWFAALGDMEAACMGQR